MSYSSKYITNEHEAQRCEKVQRMLDSATSPEQFGQMIDAMEALVAGTGLSDAVCVAVATHCGIAAHNNFQLNTRREIVDLVNRDSDNPVVADDDDDDDDEDPEDTLKPGTLKPGTGKPDPPPIDPGAGKADNDNAAKERRQSFHSKLLGRLWSGKRGEENPHTVAGDKDKEAEFDLAVVVLPPYRSILFQKVKDVFENAPTNTVHKALATVVIDFITHHYSSLKLDLAHLEEEVTELSEKQKLAVSARSSITLFTSGPIAMGPTLQVLLEDLHFENADTDKMKRLNKGYPTEAYRNNKNLKEKRKNDAHHMIKIGKARTHVKNFIEGLFGTQTHLYLFGQGYGFTIVFDDGNKVART